MKEVRQRQLVLLGLLASLQPSASMKPTILVTSASGRIGKELVARLSKSAYCTYVLTYCQRDAPACPSTGHGHTQCIP